MSSLVAKKEGRSHSLDGLRGLAALAVVFYHAILHHDLSLIPRVLYAPIQSLGSLRDLLTKLVLTIQHGEMAVFVFFVLSGAVLRLSLDRRNGEHRLAAAVAFGGARLLRLYPPLLGCLLLYYAMGYLGIGGFPRFAPQALLENVTLYKTSMHGPSTTLQAEVLAVPFLLVAWLARRALGLPGLLFTFAYSVLAIELPVLVGNLPNMHAYLMAFMAGMVAAEPALRAVLRPVPPSAWWLPLALLVFGRMFHPQSSLTALVVMVICAGFLVAGLLHAEPGSLHRFLERPVPQFLGQVSFSLYLLNVPMLYLIWAFTDRLSWPATHALESGLLVGLASLVLTVPLAWASERWIERPSIAWGRKLSARVFAAWPAPPGRQPAVDPAAAPT